MMTLSATYVLIEEDCCLLDLALFAAPKREVVGVSGCQMVDHVDVAEVRLLIPLCATLVAREDARAFRHKEEATQLLG